MLGRLEFFIHLVSNHHLINCVPCMLLPFDEVEIFSYLVFNKLFYCALIKSLCSLKSWSKTASSVLPCSKIKMSSATTAIYLSSRRKLHEVYAETLLVLEQVQMPCISSETYPQVSVVNLLETSSNLTCQNPLRVSRTENTFSLAKFGNMSSMFGI